MRRVGVDRVRGKIVIDHCFIDMPDENPAQVTLGAGEAPIQFVNIDNGTVDRIHVERIEIIIVL